MDMLDVHIRCGRRFKMFTKNSLAVTRRSNKPGYEYYGCNSALHQAAILGKHDKLLSTIKHFGVNLKDINGRTALHFASDEKIAEILIANTTSVMERDAAGITPLHMAALKGRTEIINLLISSGANPKDNNNPWKCTPLHAASANGHSSAVKVLIANGLDVNEKDSDGRTSLHAAAEQANYFPASEYQTVLKESLYSENNDKLNEITGFLTVAARFGREDMVKIHLASQSSLDYMQADRFFLLLTDMEFAETFHALVNNGAIVDCKDNLGLTPLHLAAMSGQRENITFLLDNGADINALDNWNQSPLHLSEHAEWNEASHILINRSALLDIRNSEGLTPLHFSALSGDYYKTSLLIDTKCECSPRDKNGITPLHLCSPEKKGAFREIAKCLLKGGAEVDAKDDTGQTPLHYAATVGMADILLGAGADINAVDDLGRTPIHTLSANNKFMTNAQQLMHFLIDKGIEVNARDNEGKTPLLLACNHTCASILIQRGADINVTDLSGSRTRWSNISNLK